MKKYYILIVVLCLIIIGEGVVIIFNSNQEVKLEDSYTNIPKEEENTDIDDDANADIIEDDNTDSDEENIVDGNIWLYAADYQTDDLPLYYTTSFKNTYYLQDIVLPYINIDSEDAREANEEIKEIYDYLIGSYKEGVENQTTYIAKCDYDYAKYDNVGSVLVTYGVGGTRIIHPIYVSYSFDLNTGKKLNFEEVYEKAGISSDEIDSKVREAIEDFLTAHLLDWGEDVNRHVEISYNNYLESVENNEIVYYLAADYTMQVVVELSIPADSGRFDTLLTIEGWY